MKRLPTSNPYRRGAVTPLMAFLLTLFMALVALAVDLGYIILVRAELQNAADAAALAGASQLLDPLQLQGPLSQAEAMDSAMTNARTEAQAFALRNYGGSIALTLGANSSNDPSGDVVCGHLGNPSDYSQQLVPTVPGTGPYPNAVQVRVRRDSTRNGALALFFAKALGMSSLDLQVTATATYDGRVVGFKIQTPGYTTCKLLPFALDINTWNQVVAGAGADDFSRNPSTGIVTSGPDGIPECKLYPLSNGNGSGTSGLPPGNFGTVDIGSPNNSTADIARQIRYGPNATDLSYFPGGKVQLDPTTGKLILQGDTGVSAGVKDDLATIIGQPRIIPLYESVSGPGNNARYTIVGFAGITITEVVLTGSLASKHVTIQPCFCIDPNAVTGTQQTQSKFVYKPLTLCR